MAVTFDTYDIKISAFLISCFLKPIIYSAAYFFKRTENKILSRSKGCFMHRCPATHFSKSIIKCARKLFYIVLPDFKSATFFGPSSENVPTIKKPLTAFLAMEMYLSICSVFVENERLRGRARHHTWFAV